MSLPMQKNPIQDGTSGLHYSGQIYMNQVARITAPICTGSSVSYTQVDEVFPNGVSTTALSIDPTTKRISNSALQGYVDGLKASGKIPGPNLDINRQIAVDKAFYAAVQAEYCHYEKRYLAALTQFITVISSSTGGNGQDALNKTIALNKRLNSLIEIIGYVGNDRARQVNNRNDSINRANQDINSKLSKLKAQQDFLQSSNVRLRTQEEMMRYSKEKNSAMNIQIMFFVALNVVALGTVFMVYKNVRGGPSV